MNLNTFSTTLHFITNDKFGFWFFEIVFFAIFLYAIWKDRIWPERSVVSGVFRGEESRKIFMTSASIFTTFVISAIFTIASYPKERRILLYLINLGVVIYLFFYSGWFTNKLIGWWISFKQRNFNPHGQ
jgi:hypothetical protein